MRVRRRRRQPGHVRRDAEHRRAVEPAGGLHGHQQPVRDGHRARAPHRPDRPAQARRGLRRAGLRCDGMDVVDTYEVMQRGDREGARRPPPILVEAVTYRFRGHSMADPEEYRDKEQVKEWREKDPIPDFAQARRGGPRELDAGQPSSGSTRRSSSPSRLPAARIAVRPPLRARRPGQGWYGRPGRRAEEAHSRHTSSGQGGKPTRGQA